MLPWGGATESLLFKWDELRRIAYTEIQDDTHQQPRVVSAVKTVGWSVGKDGLSGHLTQVPELRIVGTQDQNAGYIAEGALQLPKVGAWSPYFRAGRGGPSTAAALRRTGYSFVRSPSVRAARTIHKLFSNHLLHFTRQATG